MIKKTWIALFLIIQISVYGQNEIKRVLFVGNSYTSVNNLPLMVSQVVSSAGDSIEFKSNTPGGSTFNNHSQNSTTLAYIAESNWDFVVLQEQSQLPSFPNSQVETECFPYAHLLDSLINQYNPCSETVYYMTWGRKNGDASNCPSWPPVCSYEGMDSLLNLRYTQMANDNHGIISPVSVVWRYLINNSAIELYSSDESHPSVAGTYAAACTFYSILFRKDPTLITFNSSLSNSDAQQIRNATKLNVYDSLQKWNVGNYDPKANFNFATNGLDVAFTNLSTLSDHYDWNFGDGSNSSEMSPTHSYLTNNSYNVTLKTSRCNQTDSITKTITITPQGVLSKHDSEFQFYPNPYIEKVNIKIPTTYLGGVMVIKNQLGQIVYSTPINSSESSITNTLTPGIYHLTLTDAFSKKSFTYKFVKSE